MVQMKKGSFYFNGKNSYDQFGTLVQVKPDRITPAKRFNEAKPSNRDGSIFRDLGTFENGTVSLECWFKLSDTANLDTISYWLNPGKYSDFIPWYDSDYVYRAIVQKEITFINIDGQAKYYKFNLVLDLLPFKYDYTGYTTSILLPSSGSISNNTQFNAKPLLNIVPNGSADVVLTINGIVYTFKSPKTTFTVDSEIPMCSNSASMVGLDFPYLKPGSNIISYTGATSISAYLRVVRRAL